MNKQIFVAKVVDITTLQDNFLDEEDKLFNELMGITLPASLLMKPEVEILLSYLALGKASLRLVDSYHKNIMARIVHQMYKTIDYMRIPETIYKPDISFLHIEAENDRYNYIKKLEADGYQVIDMNTTNWFDTYFGFVKRKLDARNMPVTFSH